MKRVRLLMKGNVQAATRRLRRLGCGGLLAAVGLFYTSHAATPQVHVLHDLRLGDLAPDFAARDMEGKIWERSEVTGSSGVLLFFWATWSPRSTEGLSVVDGLLERYGEQGLSVVAINVEGERPDEDEIASMKEIVTQGGLKVQVLVDHGLNIFSDYGVIAVPSSVLLDSQGVIVYALDGLRTGAERELETAVRAMLGLEVAEEVPVMTGPTMNPKALRYFNMGKMLYSQGLLKKAIANFEQAAAYDSTAMRVQLWLGQTKVALEDWEGALACLDQAVTGEGFVDLAYVLRAEVKLSLGRVEEALADAEKALEIHPDYARALWAAGRAKLEAGDHEGAARAFRSSRALNPLAPESYYYLAETFLKQGRKRDALGELRGGLEIALGLRPGRVGDSGNEGPGKASEGQ